MQQIARPVHPRVLLLGFGVPKRSYYRARYYDPNAGRFLSEDPLGLTVGINVYRYAGNNISNFYDPLGLYELTPIVKLYKRDPWDPTNWGFGNTTVEANPSGEYVSGPNGWHISFKLTIIFSVQYSSQSTLKHEMEHVSIATAALKNATPQFENFEKQPYKCKADCDRNLNKKILGGPGSDLDGLLNSLTQRFSPEQSAPEPWYQRLWRKIFF